MSRAGRLLLLLLPAQISALRPTARLSAYRPTSAPRRTTTTRLIYEDDPWLLSGKQLPFSAESLEVLFRYGPVVYGARCGDGAEYSASVRKFMVAYPRISRELAEQEINEYLANPTDYLARTTAKGYEGPKEKELKPPVGLGDKVLVVAWVCILIPATQFITDLCINAPPVYR